VKRGYRLAVIALLMLAAVAVGVGMFFLVADIQVEGTSVYDADSIVEASGIEMGKSIFLIRTEAARRKIKEQFSYVDDVRIRRSFPGSVTIEISESFPAAWVEYNGAAWIMDKNARFLDVKTAAETAGLAEIEGIEPLQPVVGQTMALSVEESVKLDYLREIMGRLSEFDMMKDVSAIDIASASSVSFTYMGRFQVILGRGDDVEDKLQLLRGVVNRLDESETGRIDLSIGGRAHFLPA